MKNNSGVYLKSQQEKKIVRNTKNKKVNTAKSVKPKRKTAADTKVEIAALPEVTTNATSLNMSSGNIAQLISKFMNLRSALRKMSGSVQQVEKWLDNTYNMFEVAQMVVTDSKDNKATVSGSEPKISSKNKDKNIPVITLPKNNNKSKSKFSLAPLLQNVDLGQLIKIAQSPLFVKLMKSFLRRK